MTTNVHKILVIHGPNLNMLGKREPDIYGTESLADIDAWLRQRADAVNIELETFQTNHEGGIVEKIQEAMGRIDGLIINPAAYTHTSVAIRDAILLLDIPVIEVHLSNIYKRESFRHHSMIAGAVSAQISGLGAYGYIAALDALHSRLL